jgi:hypothetical protein
LSAAKTYKELQKLRENMSLNEIIDDPDLKEEDG